MTRLITGTYLAQTKAPSHQENPANAESTKNLNNGTRFNPDFRFSVMRDGFRLIRNLGTTASYSAGIAAREVGEVTWQTLYRLGQNVGRRFRQCILPVF